MMFGELLLALVLVGAEIELVVSLLAELG